MYNLVASSNNAYVVVYSSRNLFGLAPELDLITAQSKIRDYVIQILKIQNLYQIRF